MSSNTTEVTGGGTALRRYRVDGKFVKSFAHDAEAFDWASSFTDGPDVAKLERSIDGAWCLWTEHHDGNGRWLNQLTDKRIDADDAVPAPADPFAELLGAAEQALKDMGRNGWNWGSLRRRGPRPNEEAYNRLRDAIKKAKTFSK